MGERFFREQRIRLGDDFAKFHSPEAFEFRSTFFVLKILNTGRSVSRLGVIASKKVGNAVVRSGVRRVMREIFRKKLQKYSKSYDYLIIARRGARHASYGNIEFELLNAAATIYKQMARGCKNPQNGVEGA
ncbi:MAG: ribonuclease P protein component [Puniceicoccales bacterium]|nr:ribonuclease P protein component [Puniceicoccales bacterium]